MAAARHAPIPIDVDLDNPLVVAALVIVGVLALIVAFAPESDPK